ncbi:MAG TPA: DUF4386 domain-containing protein [Cyclobacteriaceae bacterium]|nr:DUF4386 domain-containing protein [Cyclobacteriaceae bacterium]
MENNNSQLRDLARLGGILYLIVIVTGIYAEIFVVSNLVVGNDQTTTANNIVSHEALYRSGIIAHLLTLVSSLLLLGILFRIFKSTSERLAMTMVIFNVVALTIEAVSILYEFETISILKSKMMAGVFSPDQVNSLAYQSLKMQTIGYDVALFFFGIVCCFMSALILKSKLYLRWVGLLMLLAGVCYITNSLASFISPAFRRSLLPFILIPCFIAELSFSINLIVGPRTIGQLDVPKFAELK